MSSHVPPSIPPSDSATRLQTVDEAGPFTWNPLDLSRVTDLLKQAPRWVLWRYRIGPDGPLGKIPFRTSGRRATTNDSRSWTTFEDAVATFVDRYFDDDRYDGIAFVLGGGIRMYRTRRHTRRTRQD